MSDLAALFPDIANVLAEFDRPSALTDGGLGRNEVVTDEDVDRYISGLAGRVLSPVVSGQVAPPSPEFAAGRGRQAPPATSSYVEPADTGDGGSGGAPAGSGPPAATPSTTSTPTAPDLTAPTSARSEPDEIPPSPGEPDLPASHEPGQVASGSPETSGLAPTTTDPSQSPTASPSDASGTVTINGRAIPLQQLSQLVQFNDAIAADPALRAHLIAYYNQQTLPRPAQLPYSQPTFPPPSQLPQNPQLPTPPQLSSDDLSDPTLRALYDQIQQQNAAIARANATAQEAQRVASSQQMQEYSNITNSAKLAFAERYKLTPAHMEEVERAAVSSNAVISYMRGVDPITGSPVVPNQHAAVTRALELGYYTAPTTRQLDFERRQARAARDADRRSKLAGISGSGGSVPRTPPPAKDPRASMIDEVGQMLQGTWAPPG